MQKLRLIKRDRAENDLKKMLAKAQSPTECRHTCTHRNKCHPNVHITLPATRTHTFYSSALPARELPAVGDLWENRTPPVPLSSPHSPREGLCPTGATSIYSLIPGLIEACLLLFFCCFPPPSLLFLPIAPPLCLISKHQILCNYLKDCPARKHFAYGT